jgi:hypothetical protein
VPICWKSKGQKGVTLSSSEAEYVSMSEALKVIRFVHHHLESLGLSVRLPINVKIHNIAAIFMAENAFSGVSTSCILNHILREHIEDCFIKIVFLRPSENDADIFTKNVNKVAYE